MTGTRRPRQPQRLASSLCFFACATSPSKCGWPTGSKRSLRDRQTPGCLTPPSGRVSCTCRRRISRTARAKCPQPAPFGSGLRPKYQGNAHGDGCERLTSVSRSLSVRIEGRRIVARVSPIQAAGQITIQSSFAVKARVIVSGGSVRTSAGVPELSFGRISATSCGRWCCLRSSRKSVPGRRAISSVSCSR